MKSNAINNKPIKHSNLEIHNTSYYLKCFFAGLFPCGLTHTLLTPLDVVKCRRQIDPSMYKSLGDGLKTLYKTQGLKGLFLGWQPSILGYGLQGSMKYGFYEINKDIYKRVLGEEKAKKHQTIGYCLSSAFAEIIADFVLCPFESLKVRMQTSKDGTFPTKLIPAFNELKEKEGFYKGFYKGLVPVIMRQVPNTVVKFATYENTVKFFYKNVFNNYTREEYSKFTQLLVTFMSGYVAGVFCCLVSNPADVVISGINSGKYGPNTGLFNTFNSIYTAVGILGLWRGLSTRVLIVGTLSALEWLIYDFFKSLAGLQTTGGR